MQMLHRVTEVFTTVQVARVQNEGGVMDMIDRGDEVANFSTGMLKCCVCGHNKFYEQLAVGHLTGLLDLGPLRSCSVEVCARCGYLHWFVFK